MWQIFKWGSIIAGSLCALLLAVVLGIAIATYYFGIEHNWFNLPDVEALRDLKPMEASFVYSMDDELIGCYAKEYRIVLLDEEIPEALKKAILASEDQRFYWHLGIDPIAIIRAALANYQAGRVVEGGSTLTQQVAKNWLLTPERTLDRKIKEALLAIRIEHEFTKKEILTLYTNTSFLGRSSYGFEAAARSYFGKYAKDGGICRRVGDYFRNGGAWYFHAEEIAPFSNPTKLQEPQARPQCLIEHQAMASLHGHKSFQGTVDPVPYPCTARNPHA